MPTRYYTIEGKVQGVGFRYYTREQADSLNLNGWVRNKSDGAVECVANGSLEALGKFEKELRKGPRFSQVTALRVEEKSEGVASGFQIIH